MEQKIHSQPIRVLLADDFPAVSRALRRLLAWRADMEVIGVAEDGVEAVELARSLQPDIVVMDISMPRLNGIKAAEIIHAESPQIRVIAYSIHDEMSYVQKMFEVGALGYVTKNDMLEELTGAIYAVKAGRRFLSKSIQNPTLPENERRVPRETAWA